MKTTKKTTAETKLRAELNGKWVAMTPAELLEMLEKNPHQRLRTAAVCKHKETHVMDGVRYCRRCGESLEVTSYRD